MNLYFCERSDEWWTGGLLIVAENEDDAVRVFKIYEHEPEPPFSICCIENVQATGDPRVIYDDERR